MAVVDEEILAKVGPELFKELLRVYPVADIEDYFKAGQWKNDMMKCDLQLVNMHRREAGAPDPIPLEDVRMPEMPQVAPMPAAPMPGARPPMMAGPPPARPPMAVPKAGGSVVPTPPAAAGAGAGGNAAMELRLIALFIAKWQLDPTTVKIMLAKLLPARRRYVMQHFKAAAPGLAATAALEQFIARCEQTNAWAGATAPAPAGAAPGMRPVAPAAGLKRPMTPMMAAAAAQGPAKMPRMVPVMPVRAPIANSKPAGVALRPIQPAGGLRPQAGARPPMMMRPQGAVHPGMGQFGGMIRRM